MGKVEEQQVVQTRWASSPVLLPAEEHAVDPVVHSHIHGLVALVIRDHADR